MKTPTTLLISTLAFLFGCQPQQTDIFTEVQSPDGTIARYINKSNGYGYNPNVTGNLNVGGIQGTNNAVINGWYGGGYYYNGYFGNQMYCTPGVAPIPVNMNPYYYNPTVYWNGCYYPAR